MLSAASHDQLQKWSRRPKSVQALAFPTAETFCLTSALQMRCATHSARYCSIWWPALNTVLERNGKCA